MERENTYLNKRKYPVEIDSDNKTKLFIELKKFRKRKNDEEIEYYCVAIHEFLLKQGLSVTKIRWLGWPDVDFRFGEEELIIVHFYDNGRGKIFIA